jgi:hypothetical protein
VRAILERSFIAHWGVKRRCSGITGDRVSEVSADPSTKGDLAPFKLAIES